MKTKWCEIKENLKEMLESGIFRVWVAPLDASINGGRVEIFASSQYMADFAKRHLEKEILGACARVLEKDPAEINISYRISETKDREPCASADVVASVLAAQRRLPVSQPNPGAISDWRHSFEDFVIGPANSFAVAAAQDMCGHGGQVRTLFVNSGAGLGKTHLAQAAGQSLCKSGAPLKVCYLTAEQFASRFVAAARSHELEDFKQYLCSLDVLLFEDVHFLQRKKAMQEMILNVIKNLQARGARVVFTSSFSPRELRDMDSQLVSHFCSGIIAGIEKPDQEMRREILRRKAKFFQVSLPDEICELLSTHLSSDVRQLESCLKSMAFKARLLNSGLTVDLALETLGQYAAVNETMNLEVIVRLVCESFGITKIQLCSRSRRKEYVQGRNTVFYLARKHTDMSLEEIGCMFNRRHSTVMRSITQVERELAGETRLGRQIARTVGLIERKCGIGEFTI